MSWTDERIALLTKLYTDGLSASQIAAELGGITRNAVIGKVHRLGLSGRPKKAGSSKPTVRRARTRFKALDFRRRVDGAHVAIAYDYDLETEPEMVEIPVEQRKTFLQLTDKNCHWPVGNPGTADFYFCGGAAPDESPYCSFHSRMAHQPTRNRRHERRQYRD